MILGVSVDTVDSHHELCAKDGMTFKMLADDAKKVTAQYGSLREYGKMGTLANRNTFLIDPKGVIRKVYLNVKPDPHSEEVLAALAEMQKTSGE